MLSIVLLLSVIIMFYVHLLGAFPIIALKIIIVLSELNKKKKIQ